MRSPVGVRVVRQADRRVLPMTFLNRVRLTTQTANARFPQLVCSLTPVWSEHQAFKNDAYFDEGARSVSRNVVVVFYSFPLWLTFIAPSESIACPDLQNDQNARHVRYRTTRMPAMYVVIRTASSLSATRRTTGFVMDNHGSSPPRAHDIGPVRKVQRLRAETHDGHCDELSRRYLAHCSFPEVGVAPGEHPASLTNVLWDPKSNREHMTHFVFKTFDVPAMFVTIQTAMSLFLSRRMTAIAMDTCDVMSNSVPITAMTRNIDSPVLV